MLFVTICLFELWSIIVNVRSIAKKARDCFHDGFGDNVQKTAIEISGMHIFLIYVIFGI